MADNRRLIDANETINAFTNWLTSRYDGRLPRDVVAEIPTVDAVEVVRCKDCKHRTLDFLGELCCRLHKGLAMVTDDSFCSYGERRTDEV